MPDLATPSSRQMDSRLSHPTTCAVVRHHKFTAPGPVGSHSSLMRDRPSPRGRVWDKGNDQWQQPGWEAPTGCCVIWWISALFHFNTGHKYGDKEKDGHVKSCCFYSFFSLYTHNLTKSIRVQNQNMNIDWKNASNWTEQLYWMKSKHITSCYRKLLQNMNEWMNEYLSEY